MGNPAGLPKKAKKVRCRKDPTHPFYDGVCQKCGGPSKVDAPTIDALESRLKLGVPVEKACLQVGIAKGTYYNWIKKYPEVAKRMRLALTHVSDIARTSVINQMTYDGDLALKYLDRKEKDEFSTKHVVATEAAPSTLTKEEKAELRRLFKENNIGADGLEEDNFDDEESEEV